MRHLSPEHIVDVADGCAAPAVAAHAAGCERCRAEVEALRGAIRLAGQDAPPEPSPLFWPHLAARIGQAVRQERAPAASWRPRVWRLAPAAALVVAVAAVGIGSRLWMGKPGAPAPGPIQAPAEQAQAVAGLAADVDAADDPSWLLVSLLSADVSVEDAEASGAWPPPRGVDEALTQLDGAERMELARILREEMAARTPGAGQGPGA